MFGRSRRSNISRSEVNVKRVRSARDEESSTEHETCLSQLQHRYRTERESSVEHEAHCSQNRDRPRVQKARESSVDLEAHLS